MSDERDTRDTDPCPPDYEAMTDRELWIFTANTALKVQAEQLQHSKKLTGIQAKLTLLTQHVELLGNQLVTGDNDPRTIAQRLQNVENMTTFLFESAGLEQSATDIEETGERRSAIP